MSKATPLFARTDQVIKHRSDGHQQRATLRQQLAAGIRAAFGKVLDADVLEEVGCFAD